MITAGMFAVLGGCASAPKPAIATTPPRARGPRVHPATAPATGLRIGLTATAKFNQFGLYLKKIVDSVQQEWTGLVLSQQPRPPAGTDVVVTFHLDAHGAITAIDSVDNHSSDLGQRLCLRALTSRAPFGDWTPDMKAALNPAGAQLTITFFYQ